MQLLCDVVYSRLKLLVTATLLYRDYPSREQIHAVAMSRFANDMINAMRKLTKGLEITLGPETSDLSLRVGLHSGAVTAGVLRGQRARFQLFGDAMNTAARMEQTGMKGKIQISQESAHCLVAAGKRYAFVNWHC
jgi:class 3 adenylate cyclase